MRQWTAGQAREPGCASFLPDGRFLRAVLRRRRCGEPRAAADAHGAGPGAARSPCAEYPITPWRDISTRLLRKGYRIAICDQMEDPKLTKKIVRREVTRVLSPGTALDAGLGQEQNNFLAAYHEAGLGSAEKSGRTVKRDAGTDHHASRLTQHPSAPDGLVCAVALLDISTGEFRTSEFSGPAARQQAVDEILMAGASEVLIRHVCRDSARAGARGGPHPCRRLGLDTRLRRAAGRASAPRAFARGLRTRRS